MKLKLISCEVFRREFEVAIGRAKHRIEPEFIKIGMHNDPDSLRAELQARIDSTPKGAFDYILLGYALCSRSTAELQARDVPLVLFRAHDCITVFLGSRDRYMEEFTKNPGTYYYTPGFIERWGEVDQEKQLESVRRQLREAKFREYARKYGEDNARYLIEIEESWVTRYSRAVFIDMGIGDAESYRRFVREIAERNGWSFEEIKGSWRLIDSFLSGEWGEDDFLIVPPRHRVSESFDESIMKAEPLRPDRRPGT